MQEAAALAFAEAPGDPRGVHDRLTWLCATCGLRQADGPACTACRSGSLFSLEDEEPRAHALDALKRRLVEDHEDALVRKAKSVRRAPLHFAAGSAVMLLPLGFAAMLLGPVAGTAAAATLLGGSYALGAGFRAIAPRWLLGKEERWEIAQEIDEVAKRELPVEVLHPPASAPELTRLRGRLVGTPAVGPFSDEPLLGARLVGRVRGHVIDDAWLAAGGLTLTDGSALRAERASVISLAWIGAEPSMRLDVSGCSEGLRRRLEDHLAARGVTSLEDARLEVRTISPDDHVVVAGTPRPRAISDGYRGQIEVIDLESAIVELVTLPLPAVPGPFVPPADPHER